VASGFFAQATGVDSIAIGRDANAGFANSVAIGADVTTTAANQVAIGGANATYRLAGLGAAPVGSVNGGTLLVTTDAAGNLGVANLGAAFAAVGEQIDQLDRFARDSRKEARGGIAAAMALPHTPMPSMVGRTTWAVNGSTFQGEFGVGVGIAHRLNFAVPVAFTAGVALGGNDQVGGRIGLMGEF
jgi:trimeric autotransporter adhesin